MDCLAVKMDYMEPLHLPTKAKRTTKLPFKSLYRLKYVFHARFLFLVIATILVHTFGLWILSNLHLFLLKAAH